MAEHQPKRKGSQPTEKLKKDGASSDAADPTVVHQHREFKLSNESAHLEKELYVHDLANYISKTVPSRCLVGLIPS